MPFKSLAQAGYLHSHPEILGKKGLAEWDAATKGKHLPKKLKSYEHGGTVTETGLALVHKGEQVIPRGDSMESGISLKELMAEKLGSGKPKPKKGKLHMHIRPLDDGKYHIRHEMVGGTEPTESTEHAPANMAALLDHVKEHYGPEEAEAPEGAAPPENA